MTEIEKLFIVVQFDVRLVKYARLQRRLSLRTSSSIVKSKPSQLNNE